MTHRTTRRSLLGAVPAFGAAALLGLSPSRAATSQRPSTIVAGIDSGFPRQDLMPVEAVVSFSHFNLAKVKEFVTARPALAKASWDWGFGDWESAIGAASHRGQHEIARFLIEHGARPTMFTFAMFGDVDVVRSMINAQPGIQRTHGPHGFTLMYHARIGGTPAERVVDYLEHVGDADIGEPDVKIPPEEQQRILGTYAFGETEDESVEILIERGELRIKKTGRVGRRLARVKKLEYHPTGAPAVRIRFAESNSAIETLTIEDGQLSIDARRK